MQLGRSFDLIFLPEQFYGKFILICLVVNVLHHLNEPEIEMLHVDEYQKQMTTVLSIRNNDNNNHLGMLCHMMFVCLSVY